MAFVVSGCARVDAGRSLVLTPALRHRDQVRIVGNRFALARPLLASSVESGAGIHLASFAGCELWRAIDLAAAESDALASNAESVRVGRTTIVALANTTDAAAALQAFAAFFVDRRHPSVPRILGSTTLAPTPWVAFRAGLGPSFSIVGAQPGTVDDAILISLLRDLAGALRDRMRHPHARVLGPLDATRLHVAWDGHAYLGTWREADARFSTSMRELTSVFAPIIDQHRDLFFPALAVDPFAFADAVEVLASRTPGATPADVSRFLSMLFADAYAAESARQEEEALWAAALEL